MRWVSCTLLSFINMFRKNRLSKDGDMFLVCEFNIDSAFKDKKNAYY